MVISPLVVYSRDFMTDWEQWLATPAQHNEKVLYHIITSSEKDQN